MKKPGKYIRKPCFVQAFQWFKQGDQPLFRESDNPFIDEFKVGFVSHGELLENVCGICEEKFKFHGWLVKAARDGDTICPSDWIVFDKYGFDVLADRQFKSKFDEYSE